MTQDERFEAAVADARAGRLEQAEIRCRELLDEDPRHPKANLMLGISAARGRREDEAISRLGIVLEVEPENAEALKWIAGALNRQRRFDEAAEYATRAVAVSPDDYIVQLALAQALVGMSKLEESSAAFVRAIRIEPKREAAYRGLYYNLASLGRPQEARSVLAEASKNAPSHWCHLRLAELTLQHGQSEEAIRWAQLVPAGTEEAEAALVALAAAYGRARMPDQELETLDRLAAAFPGNRFLPMLRAGRLQLQGLFKEAEVEFRRGLEVDSKLGEAYFGIVSGRRVEASDLPLVDQMVNVVDAGGLRPDEAGPLHFALGKANEDLGRFEEAMSHYVEGNRLVRAYRVGPRPFDRAGLERTVDRTIDLFTKEFLESHRDERIYEPTPILVAGAMRSGTTLVEQILSSHPEVGAAGEQVFWRDAARDCLTFDPYDPEAGVHHDVIRKKAWEYVRQLRTLAPGRAFVTDKDPGNHRIFGIIHLALPDSPLIQLRRNLTDVALSMFTSYFQTQEEYIWDRADIVFALKQHVRLEEHWRHALPADKFFEVDYRELVTNTEPILRRVLEFCGLEWDDACLRSEENERVVRTPSFWQVRQPINPRSVDRWRKYEPWLGPLAELVAEV
jgi:tetratricopeptide (TPR) repeat protein